MREVYDQAQAYSGPGPGLPETVRRSRRVKQQRRFQKQLWSICQPYLGSDTPMRVLCQRVERFLPELFTFIVEPRAGADNNPAERSLRPPVVSRKISGGTRSAQGSETKSIMASLFGTWRLQGRTLTMLSIPSSPNPYLPQSEQLPTTRIVDIGQKLLYARLRSFGRAYSKSEECLRIRKHVAFAG